MLNRVGVFCLAMMLCAQVHSASISQTTLNQYAESGDILRLEGKRDEATLSIPLAAGQQVKKASVELAVVSSAALVKRRSILNVRFNNATIGQILFDPERPQLTSTVDIPAQLWRHGFNSLTFAVSQHYANQCVDGGAPELWSEINLGRSNLKVHSESVDTPLTLQSLSHFFGPGIGAQSQVTLINTKEAAKEVVANALPLVAQALALRSQYVPLQIRHLTLSPQTTLPVLSNSQQWSPALTEQYYQSSWYIPASDKRQLHVLVGQKQTLAKYLGKEMQQKINGPFLGIENTRAFAAAQSTRIPAIPRLIVSGTTPEEVRKAAKTLALMDDALNPDNTITVTQDTSGPATTTANILKPDNTYTFGQLGQNDITFTGEGQFEKTISLRLPADFYVPESASVKLALDFAYGAAVGPGSMMNVMVNDELVHGRPLDNINGQAYRGYQLSLPARYLRGGLNTINLAVTMRAPLTGQPCDDVGGSHMLFQLQNSSSVSLPEAGSVVSQPNLGLFKETAFPFARSNEMHSSGIYMTSDVMTGAALTLVGKLAQTAGAMLPNLYLSYDIAQTLSGNAFLLSTPDQLPQDLAQGYKASLSATKQWPYRMQNALHNRIYNFTDTGSEDIFQLSGITKQKSTLGEMAVISARKNPRSEETGSLYILAAQTPELLNQRVDDLISLSLWGQLEGDFFSWQNASQPLLAMQVEQQFQLGEEDNRLLELRMWLSNNPWYWLLALAVLILLCTTIAVVLLRRRNQAVTEDW
ncbi:cellulose biosynthesis cyclic di-GMP-binding regulatory protein BcsB [Alteromonas lipotrueiana]|uniref:cellulose biosynthesis cyclic di-GMP-binding regulatory protein BcsB n=1 Tax=Alteromonas lipotrueiana TaxID=2803815 RepID=UPI001C44A8AB|nr:cellulose biosynthesis cyclic di-GMP-binding regulatory protein BcsB [Alteromonas lipotrueiana]